MADISRNQEQDGDLGIAFWINSPIRLDQFDWELSQGLDAPNAQLSADGDLDLASPADPAVLFVGLRGAAPTKVLSVGKAHTPDPEWFPRAVASAQTPQDVARKAAQGGVLSAAEIQVALQALLSRADL